MRRMMSNWWWGVMATLLGLAGCDRAPIGHHKTKPPVAHGPIILLPDGAIAVAPGSPEARLAQFMASKEPPPRTFRFGSAEFAPWASQPTPETLRAMYTLLQVLRAYPHATVTLTGYTDNDGTAEQNRVLARARVARLREILIHGGIDPDRIEAVGKGATDFIGDNATEAGRALNRRIEVTVTAK